MPRRRNRCPPSDRLRGEPPRLCSLPAPWRVPRVPRASNDQVVHSSDQHGIARLLRHTYALGRDHVRNGAPIQLDIGVDVHEKRKRATYSSSSLSPESLSQGGG